MKTNSFYVKIHGVWKATVFLGEGYFGYNGWNGQVFLIRLVATLMLSYANFLSSLDFGKGMQMV